MPINNPVSDASGIVSGRFPVDRLPAMTDEKIWKGTGGNVEEVDIPVAITFTECMSVAHTATDDETWEDWDISAIVATGTKYAEVVINLTAGTHEAGVRKNGSAVERKLDFIYYSKLYLLTEVDSNRIIEIYAKGTADIFFYIVGYWT